MNIENVNKAIAVMERVKARNDAFDLTTYQELYNGDEAIETEADLHDCGTAACFAGWVAVSPEFKADGGRVGDEGEPVLGENSGGGAIEGWLGVPRVDARDLCGLLPDCLLYRKPHEDVTVGDVLDVLCRLRDTGSVYP